MGHFDKYTVDDIREIVEYDRPDAMSRQALTWTAIADLLAAHAAELKTESTALAKYWTGRSAAGFHNETTRATTAMRDAAETAASNAHGWAEIAEIVGWARDEVLRIHAEWRAVLGKPPEPPDPRIVPDGIAVVVGEPRDLEALREPFDLAARAVMDSAAEATTELHHRYLAVPQSYRPPSAGTLPLIPASSDTADTRDGEGPESEHEDAFFGSRGPHVAPTLQGTASPHAAVGGVGSAPGGVPSASGGGPMLASAPMRPVIADRFSRTAKGGTWRDGTTGTRFSRTPKQYTGDNTSNNKLVVKRHPVSVDSDVERLSRRASTVPDEDDPWRPSRPAVPGVITDTTPPEPPFHDPGTVIGGR